LFDDETVRGKLANELAPLKVVALPTGLAKSLFVDVPTNAAADAAVVLYFGLVMISDDNGDALIDEIKLFALFERLL
jgi:hypothetical protein